MEKRSIDWGGSLPVPNVQELVAKGSPATIPLRYVRTDQDPPLVPPGFDLPEIPIIDMKNLLLDGEEGSDPAFRAELGKLDSACREWGFFQLVNHGISATLLDKVKSEARELFNLSIEEKKKLWQKPGDLDGFGQAFVVSEEQKLDWNDIFALTFLPKYIRKPHIFDNLENSLRDALEAYSAEIVKLTTAITRNFAKALNMEDGDMAVVFHEGLLAYRINYYPPCQQPELAIGLTPHSDASALTLLLQANDTDGLQIKKDGQWVPVKPHPNALVINIGDVMEIVSNGAYRSIEHRAVVNSANERISIASFIGANVNGEIGPAPSLISPNNPQIFKRITTLDYLKGRFSKTNKGKSYLDAMRITKD